MYMVSYALIVLQNDCVKEISEVGVRYDAFCNSGPFCNSDSSIVLLTTSLSLPHCTQIRLLFKVLYYKNALGAYYLLEFELKPCHHRLYVTVIVSEAFLLLVQLGHSPNNPCHHSRIIPVNGHCLLWILSSCCTKFMHWQHSLIVYRHFKVHKLPAGPSLWSLVIHFH